MNRRSFLVGATALATAPAIASPPPNPKPPSLYIESRQYNAPDHQIIIHWTGGILTGIMIAADSDPVRFEVFDVDRGPILSGVFHGEFVAINGEILPPVNAILIVATNLKTKKETVILSAPDGR